jgi:serine/threonine protein kinase
VSGEGLSDRAFERLRQAVDWPDLKGTRYEAVREIGRGGMGVVYEAWDRDLRRPVALKVLASAASEPGTSERLRREAQIIAGLEHPGIVPVHDVGALPDGRVFYAMKLVSGARLDRIVHEGRSREELLRIFVRITEPLAFAHARGVVHRDLKPENLMVGSFGEVLVMDWGIAKKLDEQAPASFGASSHGPETAHGTILGTPGYMAPEQARGERVDVRADVFALGGILGFILTGRPPTSDPPGPGLVPRPLESVFLKAREADPSERYPGVLELGRDVERFLSLQRVSAYPEPVWARLSRLAVRYRTPVLVVLAYLLMRVLLLFAARI